MLRAILVGVVALLVAADPAVAADGAGRGVQAQSFKRRTPAKARPAPRAKKKKPRKAKPKRAQVAKKKQRKKKPEPRRPMP